MSFRVVVMSFRLNITFMYNANKTILYNIKCELYTVPLPDGVDIH